MKFCMLALLMSLGISTLTAQDIDSSYSIECDLDSSLFREVTENYPNGLLKSRGYLYNNDKAGYWENFDQNGRLTRLQNYCGKLLADIYYRYLEDGKIIERFDSLREQYLPKQIRLQAAYPVLAVEQRKEGNINDRLFYDPDCILVSYEIQNHLGYGIDEEVIRVMDEMVRLSDKYRIQFQNCHEKEKVFVIEFKLE